MSVVGLRGPLQLGAVAVALFRSNKKSPQIVGLRPPMCWTNFVACKHNANPRNILLHLHLCAMTSRRISIQSVAASHQGWIHWGLGVGVCANRKPTHDFPKPRNTMFSYILYAAVWPEFHCPIMAPNSTPIWGLGWT